MAAQRPILDPVSNPETQAFWDAAAQGKLMVPHCRACSRTHWYPRAICPHCHSTDVELREASGKAEIYSYSIMARVPEPYVVAYVRLKEGTTVLTNIVDCDLAAIHVGMKVKPVFVATVGGEKMPMFTKA